MLRSLRTSFLVGLAGSVALACSGPANLGQRDGGGGSSSGGGGHVEQDAGSACSDFAAAKCAKFDSCTHGMYTPIHYGSQSICQMREETACLGILAAPDTTATPNGFEQCGKDLANAACIDFFDTSNQTPACTPQVGSRANGRSCVNNGQCQSTWCYTSATSQCGVCETRPPAGTACETNADCGGKGMLCSKANTCGMAATSGAPCSMTVPCGYGLSCVTAGDAGAGTCQAEGSSAGASCDAKLAKGPLCSHDDGFFCPSATDQCTALTIADAGAPCGLTPGMLIPGADASTPSKSTICTAGGACDPSTGSTGTCVAPAAEGAKCDTVMGPPCLKPARCVTGSDAATSGTCAILELTAACN